MWSRLTRGASWITRGVDRVRGACLPGMGKKFAILVLVVVEMMVTVGFVSPWLRLRATCKHTVAAHLSGRPCC